MIDVPALVVDYITPTLVASNVTTAPAVHVASTVVKCIPPALVVAHAEPAPAMSAAPAPVVEHISSTSAVSYVASVQSCTLRLHQCTLRQRLPQLWSSSSRQRLLGQTWHQRRSCPQRQCQWLNTLRQCLLCHARRQLPSGTLHQRQWQSTSRAGRHRDASTLDRVHPHVVSAPAGCAAPAPVVEYIASACAVIATCAPVVEFAPAPAMSFVAPAPVVKHIVLAPAMLYVASAPAPAPAVFCTALAPAVHVA